METKYTPGPWNHNGLREPYSTEGKSPSDWLANSVWTTDSRGEHIPICTTAFSVGRYEALDVETRDANARLIAEAPTMYELLKEALPYVERAYYCAFPDEQENERIQKAIEAALAAVEGR